MHDDAVELTLEDETKHYFTVWDYFPNVIQHTPVAIGKSPVLETMVAQLHNIHSLPNLPPKSYSKEDVENTIFTRIQFGARHFDVPKKQLQLLEELVAVFITDDIFERGDKVACHGDPHMQNYVSVPADKNSHTTSGTRTFWKDFEAVSQAPRELDLAVMSLTYQRSFKMPELFAKIVAEYEKHSPLDYGLIRQFEAVKAVSGAAYVLLSYDTQRDVFENRLYGLSDMMYTGNFPKDYANHFVL